jgi:hypothetical protein
MEPGVGLQNGQKKWSHLSPGSVVIIKISLNKKENMLQEDEDPEKEHRL